MRSKHVFIALIGSLILLLVALLPTALSSPSGTSFILSRINPRIPGSIDIKKLSLSWFGDQKVKEFALRDSSKDPILQIENIEVDAPLWKLIFTPSRWNKIQVSNGSLKIVQDAKGVSNLEDALGLKKWNPADLKKPVFAEQVSLDVAREVGDSILILAKGNSRQNDVKGQFSIDISLDEDHNFLEQKFHLNAERFPILILDQSLAISNDQLSGALLAFFGDYIDVVINQSPKEGFSLLDLSAVSPFFKGQVKGKLAVEEIQLEPDGFAQFSLPLENLKKLQNIFDFHAVDFVEPLSGQIRIGGWNIPLFQEELDQIAGQIQLTTTPFQVFVEEDQKNVTVSSLEGKVSTQKGSSEISLEMNVEAIEQMSPITFQTKLHLPKTPLIRNDHEKIASLGIKTEGKFSGNLPFIDLEWKGVIREINSELKIAFASDPISVAELKLAIPYIPVDDLMKDPAKLPPFQGSATFKEPEIHFIKAPVLASSDEITMSWLLDMPENTLKINILGKTGGDSPQDSLRGSIRVEDFYKDRQVDFDTAALQADLHWIGFETEFMQPYITSYPLKRILGSHLDAEFGLTRNHAGTITGSLDIRSQKKSEAFLKKVQGKFGMQNENQDMTFHLESEQAIGSTQFEGTCHDILDRKGNITFENASFSLKGHLKHFPVGVVTKVVTGDTAIADAMEAVLGFQIDSEIFAQVKNKNGPINAFVKGLNGQFNLDAELIDNIVFLKKPLTASLKVTPQLEHAVLREYLPILGSVIGAENPLELMIPVEGFSLNFNKIDVKEISFQNAVLTLGKLQFGKDSNLGKIVSLLNIPSSQFDVWFMPIYFSLENGILHMQRTDMLVAKNYPMAAWGTVDLDHKQVNVTAAISGAALKTAFPLGEVNRSNWIQIPIKGSTHHPKVDVASITNQISILAATTAAGKPGKIIGSIIETASDLIGKDKIPEPTTTPLPWQDQLTNPPEETNPVEKVIEKPVDELRKGAKKLLKGLFGA